MHYYLYHLIKTSQCGYTLILHRAVPPCVVPQLKMVILTVIDFMMK